MVELLEVSSVLSQFGGDPQKAASLASFLGFQPFQSPVDQLAGPQLGNLKLFFAQRTDRFGVKEFYRVGSYDAKGGTVGLWMAVLSEWGTRSTDRDRSRRRVARALVERVPDARAMAILVPNELQRSYWEEVEFVIARVPSAVGSALNSSTAVSSVRALVNLADPKHFHRDLLKDLTLQPGISLLDVS
jgi:hypothetical protein